jgi:flagellar hook-basal body complex protein FliE
MKNLMTQQFNLPALPQIPQIPMPLKGQVTAGTQGSFGELLTNMLGKVNTMMNKSEQLTEAAVVTGKVNLHEVMIAMAEEEVALGLTTQVAGKFISTIEKLTQMQV